MISNGKIFKEFRIFGPENCSKLRLNFGKIIDFFLKLKAGDTSVGDISIQGCDPDTSQNIDDELDVINEDIVKRGGTANNDTDDKERSLLMPIDQAILKSIEACPSDEMKKKMYSSILIVGGGMKFRNADKFLMQKLALQVNVCLTNQDNVVI